jgi:hypothetical protein
MRSGDARASITTKDRCFVGGDTERRLPVRQDHINFNAPPIFIGVTCAPARGGHGRLTPLRFITEAQVIQPSPDRFAV